MTLHIKSKWDRLEDFVAALARKHVPENVATEQTAKEAKRLGLPVDDGEVAKLFDQHYSRNAAAPTSSAGQRIRLKKKPKLRLKRKQKPKPAKPERSTYQLGDELPKGNWNKYHRDFYNSQDVCDLGHLAHRALHCLFHQWNGFTDKRSNNGQLKATLLWMQTHGWGTCNDKSLAKALTELLTKGLIRLVKKHNKGRPALYALVYLEDLIRRLQTQ